MELNQIYNGNCLDILREIEDDYVDLTVTSPPYDNLRDYEWYDFNFEWIAKELYRVTKKWWVVVRVVNDATINGSETWTSFKQALYFKEIWFNLHDTMIWRKTTPVPQFKTKRYTQAFEYMFIFSKGKPNTCNYLEENCKTAGSKKNRNNRWAFSMQSADKPRDEITVTKDTKILSNVWEYSVWWHKDLWHPAIFPLPLAKDHIVSWSNEWDIVLDPMCWSWTTCLAAKQLKRNYIGIDISQKYCEISRDRLME